MLFKNKPNLRALFSGFILAAIAVVCTIGVLYVEHDTKDAIQQQRDEKEQKLINSLFPHIKERAHGTINYQCKLISDRRIGKNMRGYIATDSTGNVVGFISSYSTSRGYSNPLVLIAGTDAKGKVSSVDIQFSRETPGIGDKVERRKGNFLLQFDGRTLENSKWDVKKFGGDFDYITGATVTSRAIVLATKDLLEVLKETDISKLKDCK